VKLGIFISIAFVLILTVVVIVKVVPHADPPTRATSPDKLEMVTLAEDMPRLYRITDVSDNAMTHYNAAIEYFQRHRNDLQRSTPSDEHADALADHLIKAMHAGQVPEGFLDQQTPIKVGMGQNTGDLPAVASAVLKVLEDRAKEQTLDEKDRETALALFALGERAFRQNVLIGNRQFGLSLMIDGGGYLGAFALQEQGRTTDDLNATGDAVNEVIDVWMPKLRTIMGTDPHVGDLLNVAKNDEDRTFRIAATLQMGVAKFTDGNPGNRSAINAYLDDAQQSDDRMLAKAAAAADSLTLEEFRTLR
jgi:hypothetical protein